MSGNEIKTVERDLPLAQENQAPAFNPVSLLNTAVANNLDIDKLEKLLDLQDRWERREADKAFDSAFAIAQAGFDTIRKDQNVSYKSTSYNFASFDAIITSVKTPLAENGFSFSFEQKQDGNFYSVTCILRHKQGGSRSTTLSSLADNSGGKNAVQAVGSIISYLKRYTLTAILGLSFSDDDDGQSSSQPGAGYTQEVDYKSNDLISFCEKNGREIGAMLEWAKKCGLCAPDRSSVDQLSAMEVKNIMRKIKK